MKSYGGDRVDYTSAPWLKMGWQGGGRRYMENFHSILKSNRQFRCVLKRGAKITTFHQTFNVNCEPLQSQGVIVDVAWMLQDEMSKINHSAITWSYSDIQ